VTFPKPYTYNLTLIQRIIILVVSVLYIAIQPIVTHAAEPIKIGILAYRSKAQTLKQWQPLAVALKKNMPERDFVIEVFTNKELLIAANSRQTDFILTNPSSYINLAQSSGVSAPLATLATNTNGQLATVFGGVIFSLASQTNINKLTDLKGKTIAISNTDSLGGYQIQAYTLSHMGISIANSTKRISLGMPQDKVVYTVLAGGAEIGFVRTGVLEAMAQEGKIDIKQLKVLNRQSLPDFPVQVSTRLFPEWIFASMPHIEENTARHVAATLFQLEENTEAVNAIGIHGFVVPADYSQVTDLLKELRAPPYEHPPSFTLHDVVERYRGQLLIVLLGLAAILTLSFRLLNTKRKLLAEQGISLLQKQHLQISQASLQATIDAIPDLMFELGLDGEYYSVTTNSNNQHLLYAPEKTLIGLRVSEVLPEDAANIVLAALHEADQTGYSQGWQFALDLANGKSWYELSVAKKISSKNQQQRFVVLSRDITQRKTAEEDQRIAAIVFESQEAMVVADKNNVIVRVNSAFTHILGYSAQEVIGQTPRLFKSDRQDTHFYQNMWEQITTHGQWHGEIWNKCKNNDIIPMHAIITAVKGADGLVAYYVATLTDITERKRSADEIEHLAFYDALTNLPNRRMLLDRLKLAFASSKRNHRDGALLFLDLDNFKTLNDSLGHAIGDLLLQQVASRLTNCLRESDTIARVARLGGDEFVVMLEDLSGDTNEAAAQVQRVAQKILTNLSQPFTLDSYQYLNSVSIGAALFSEHEHSPDDLLQHADIAMYQAKKAGRNNMLFFNPNMQDAINARTDLERELRKAVDTQQFQLYYQVQVDYLGDTMGAEALIRWNHPERGMISPYQFIPLAEETGLILAIGQWVLNTACEQLKAWQNNEITRDWTISVNVSAKQFHQADFATTVFSTIQRHTINPRLLKIELTESMLLEKIDETIITMNRLRSMGINFSLDDFGTGYSSLQYLKRLPLNQLKIDQSFIRDIASDHSDQAIVRTIIAMAQSLNLEVIAEGVETDKQLGYLRNYGCNHFQGYLFSKPITIEAFEKQYKKPE
jgi:diguanylate cyclase (GGDEF)-like protein/PAS domain S-box-containing protein